MCGCGIELAMAAARLETKELDRAETEQPAHDHHLAKTVVTDEILDVDQCNDRTDAHTEISERKPCAGTCATCKNKSASTIPISSIFQFIQAKTV